MANVAVMWKLFDFFDHVVADVAEGDDEKAILLNQFLVRLLSTFDGVEGPDLKWKGIALVAREDLPETVQEINDEFLHTAWSEGRDEGRKT